MIIPPLAIRTQGPCVSFDLNPSLAAISRQDGVGITLGGLPNLSIYLIYLINAITKDGGLATLPHH